MTSSQVTQAGMAKKIKITCDRLTDKGKTYTEKGLRFFWRLFLLFVIIVYFIQRLNGGGFFLACEDFGRMFDNSFAACAIFKSGD